MCYSHHYFNVTCKFVEIIQHLTEGGRGHPTKTWFDTKLDESHNKIIGTIGE